PCRRCASHRKAEDSTMTEVLPAGERARLIMSEAVEAGVYVASKQSQRTCCLRLHAKGMLSRDRKSSDTYYPTEKAKRAAEPDNATAAPHQPAEQGGGMHESRSIMRRRIDSIDVGTRLRPVDMARVEALKASITELGLKTPV